MATRPARKPSIPAPLDTRSGRSTTTTILLLGIIFMLFLQWSVYGGNGSAQRVVKSEGFGKEEVLGSSMGEEDGVVSVVLMKFRVGVEEERVEHTCKRILELKDKAVGQGTKKSYIRRIIGGRNDYHLGDDSQKGMTHAFVFEFGSEADRMYYLEKDPVARAFRESVKDFVGEVQVLGFKPGDWGMKKGNARGGGS